MPAPIKPEHLRQSVAARFERNVERGQGDECDLWTGSKKQANEHSSPYGAMWVDGRNRYATSIAWWLEFDYWPDRPNKGEEMCHHCDVTLCVKLNHLWLGNASQNALDAFAKGRRKGRSGESHPMTLLANKEIPVIRARAIAGEDYATIARDYDITKTTVSEIKTGHKWASVV